MTKAETGQTFFNAGVNYAQQEDSLAWFRHYQDVFHQSPKTIVLGLIVLLAALLVMIFCMPNLWQIRFRPTLVTAAALGSIMAMCVLRFSQESPFLYFQF